VFFTFASFIGLESSPHSQYTAISIRINTGITLSTRNLRMKIFQAEEDLLLHVSYEQVFDQIKPLVLRANNQPMTIRKDDENLDFSDP
jgi:hypothetical protein